MASNASTNEKLVLCTRNVNESCWNYHVTHRNQAYAEQMAPVFVMMVVFMVVGLLGNTVVIVLYQSKPKKTSANIFIMFLAGIDLFSCAVIHPYVIYKLFYFYNQTWTFLCKIFEFLMHFNLSVSSLSLVMIAVDRFLAICRPVKYLTFDRYVSRAVGLTCFLALVFSLPILEFYGPTPIRMKVGNNILEGYTCHYQQRYILSSAMAVFSGTIMVGFLVQIFAMTILYRHVAMAAYRSRRRVGDMNIMKVQETTTKSKYAAGTSNSAVPSRLTAQVDDNKPGPSREIEEMPSSSCQTTTNGPSLNEQRNIFCIESCEPQNHKRGITMAKRLFKPNKKSTNPTRQAIDEVKAKRLKAAKILFLVTIVYVLSWMPFFVLRICNTLRNDTCHPESYLGEILDTMLNHVFYINNAINPILYAIINKAFREEFQNMLRRRFRCHF